MTITEAIKKVMLESGFPMTVNEAYQAIIDANLYEFHADNPIQIVRGQVRRHCEGVDFPSAKPTKHFKLIGENKYWLLEQPTRPTQKNRTKRHASQKELAATQPANSLQELQNLYSLYILDLKNKILLGLKQLSPQSFELFSKQLLDVYGFHDTNVTSISGDGGIDGHGKLKVGLANLNVAFQCKRWTKGNIQRPEVDKFRGAIQGDFEQGIFFTTASFSDGAINVSIKRGAVPIVLVDGESIVEMMIKKGFGVQLENISIPIYALDLALESSS